MAFRDLFVSRHTKLMELEVLHQRTRNEFLEGQTEGRLAILNAAHLKQIELLEKSHAAEIERLAANHKLELDSARETIAWERQEVERLRSFLVPSMQPVYSQVRAAHEPPGPEVPPDPDANLTPFERMVKREQAAADKAAEDRKKKREELQREAATPVASESGAPEKK